MDKGYLHLNRPPMQKMDSLSSKSSATSNLPTTPVKDYRDVQELHQATTDKISLPVFLSRHHKNFPVRIRVCKGFCGSDEETSISDGDQFNVHFIKYTTIIAIEYENGSRFNVPLNSAIPFAILFNPHNNINEAMTGYKFEKVSDILQMATLPTLLWARRAYQGSTSDSSVSANELLIVRKVRSKLLGSKSLKVYSLTTGKDKVLSANCSGNFSTKPRDVCLYLPEILKHMPDVFPCKAVLFSPQSDTTPRKQGHQRTGSNSKLGIPSTVTLLHSSVETSLVATSVHDQDPENARLLDLPISLDILVRTEENVDEDETQRLYEDTSFIYEHFNPANIRPMVENSNQQTQSQFYTNVCFGQERSGVDVTKPPMIQAEPHYQTPREARTSSDPVPIESIYHPPTSSPGNSGSGVVSNGTSPADTTVWRPPLPPPRKSSESEYKRKRSEAYAYVDTHPRTTKPVDQPNYRRAPAGASEQASPLSRSLPDSHVTDMCSFGSTGSGGACVASRRGSANGKPSSNSDSGVVEAAKRVARLTSGFPIQESASVHRQTSAPTPHTRPSDRPDSIMFNDMLEDLDQMSKDLESCLVVEHDDYSTSGISDGSSSGDSGDGSVQSNDQSGAPMSPDAMERNKRFLRAMDNTQIIKLLEAMDLTQYIETFRQQHINGDILSELDGEILQNELGVKSRLHCIRLQKVISGKYSVTELMAGRTDYVYMHPS